MSYLRAIETTVSGRSAVADLVVDVKAQRITVRGEEAACATDDERVDVAHLLHVAVVVRNRLQQHADGVEDGQNGNAHVRITVQGVSAVSVIWNMRRMAFE